MAPRGERGPKPLKVFHLIKGKDWHSKVHIEVWPRKKADTPFQIRIMRPYVDAGGYWTMTQYFSPSDILAVQYLLGEALRWTQAQELHLVDHPLDDREAVEEAARKDLIPDIFEDIEDEKKDEET
jgi:hypothetical protein